MNSNYNIDNRIYDLRRCFERFVEKKENQKDGEEVINIKSVIDFMRDKCSVTLIHLLERMSHSSKFINFDKFLIEFYYFTVEGGFEKYVDDYFRNNSADDVNNIYLENEFSAI